MMTGGVRADVDDASQRFLRVNDVDLHVNSVVTVLVLGASAQRGCITTLSSDACARAKREWGGNA